jgi:hypothetical protein
MRRTLFVLVAMGVSTLPMTINVVPPGRLHAASGIVGQSKVDQPVGPVSDQPPDTTPYARALTREDTALGPAISPPNTFVADVVVNNTNPNLKNTDTFNDGEPSIAINPTNTSQISILAFSYNGNAGGGSWGNPNSAPIWYSTDNGNTWTKQSTIPPPPGDASSTGCPCDQAPDYDRSGNLSGTFLTANVFSGTTTNPANAGSWNWFLSSGNAVRTNSVGPNNVDQPWLLVNRDTTTAAQDDVYVAYDDFNTNPVNTRVAVSLGANPPNFTRDNQSGSSGGTGIINPGHRLATDPRNGWVYSLFQRANGNGAGTVDSATGSYNIRYFLNRSTDGGQTWGLNGMGGGVQVANADSKQGINPGATFSMGNCTSNNTYKFGTVNALLGGVDHAAVDPVNGDVYFVYGNRDSMTGNNRLSIIRLTDNGAGGLTIGASNFVTGQVEAALPSVAVTTNGVVGVLYTQYDGMSGGFPMFSVHLALSQDQGVTFPNNVLLEQFLSSASDSGACRQRVFGDYHQVKVAIVAGVGTTFSGVFTGNGSQFGRSTSNHDPIFFRYFAACTGITCPANITQSNDPNQCGAVVNYAAPTSNGDCGPVTCTPVSGSFFPKGATTVTCTAQSGSMCSFSVTVNDTQPPTITCPANVIVTAKPTCPPSISQTVTFSPTATDNCPGVTTSCSPASGSSFPVGTTTVTCTATDTSGNTATCSFTVTVFSACLVDESNPGSVVLFNAQTGDYRFCCSGLLLATGRGVLTIRSCIGTIDEQKGNRKVHIEFDFSANGGRGKGTAALFLNGSSNPKCAITDMSMAGNVCTCP